MRIAIKLLLLGSLPFLALACRSDRPPVLSRICILDGHGGGDCVLASGDRVYMAPSEMVNMWATTEVDQQNFASWCYKTSPKNIVPAMAEIKAQAQTPEN